MTVLPESDASPVMIPIQVCHPRSIIFSHFRESPASALLAWSDILSKYSRHHPHAEDFVGFLQTRWQNTWYELYDAAYLYMHIYNTAEFDITDKMWKRDNHTLGDVISQSNKVKAAQRTLPDDQSWLARSAGSDNSITPVNSTSTVSPPPHVGHGCMWVEWSSSPSRIHYLLFVFSPLSLSHRGTNRADRGLPWELCTAPPLQPHWLPVLSDPSCYQWLPPPPPVRPQQPAKWNQLHLRTVVVA